MTLCKDIKYCANEMLRSHHIHCEPADKIKIIRHLSGYMEYMIFNMISVVCVISLSLGVNKLLDDHMQFLQAYVDKRCSMQKPKATPKRKGGDCAYRASAGAFNTATFYGVPEPQYSAANPTFDVMQADISGGVARPALQSTAFLHRGGMRPPQRVQRVSACSKVDRFVLYKINSIFKFFKIRTEKDLKFKFLQLFHKYMGELFVSIKKYCKVGQKNERHLTLKQLKSVIMKSRIMK